MKLVVFVLVSILSCSASAGIKLGTAGNLLTTQTNTPCRAFGVNYNDAFTKLLANGSSVDYVAGFEELGRYKIPFARVPVMGFWPSDNQLYMTNKAEYFTRLDKVFAQAELNHVGLMPSLFFNIATVPDLVGEPVNAWENPNSRTIDFMRTYVGEIFARYGNSPSLWAIEFSNEVNLYTNLPNQDIYRPKVNEAKGTPGVRSEADEIKVWHYLKALSLFTAQVRKYSAVIPISSGNSMPRAYSYNNWKYNSWSLDTSDQFNYMLWLSGTYGIGLVSVHLYPHHKEDLGHLYAQPAASYRQILDRVQASSVANNTVAFVGEFGVPASSGTSQLDNEREFFKLMDALYDSGVSLAALWVYRFDFQSHNWDVRGTNDREYQLKKLMQFNDKIRTQSTLCY